MAGMQLEQEVTRRVEARRAMLEVRLQQVLVRVNAVRDQKTEALCLELDEAKAYSALMVEWVRPPLPPPPAPVPPPSKHLLLKDYCSNLPPRWSPLPNCVTYKGFANEERDCVRLVMRHARLNRTVPATTLTAPLSTLEDTFENARRAISAAHQNVREPAWRQSPMRRCPCQ